MSDAAARSTPEPNSSGESMPPERTQPNPTAGETVRAWVVLTAPTVLVNLLLYVVATGAGATLEADIGTMTVDIGPLPIAIVTAGALLSSTVVWAAVAHRSPGFAELWVPLGWGVGLVSLAGILGVSGVGAALALGVMHVVTTIVAAHLLPRQLPRN